MIVSGPCTNKETWVVYALASLRNALVYNPSMLFTAESFIRGHITVAPVDPRWAGAVFQRAKREGLIKQLMIGRFEYLVKAPTTAGHLTPVWVKA